jgi:hypothetical protein
MGALIGARLAETVVKELTIEINAVVFWSDSTTVLHWIKQISSSYKAFVGNRVSEIHSVVHELETKLGADTVTWRYIPTDVNPADDISRGLSPSELTMGHRYLSGPEFLKTETENWPKNKVNLPSERGHGRKKGNQVDRYFSRENTFNQLELVFVSGKAKTSDGLCATVCH